MNKNKKIIVATSLVSILTIGIIGVTVAINMNAVNAKDSSSEVSSITSSEVSSEVKPSISVPDISSAPVTESSEDTSSEVVIQTDVTSNVDTTSKPDWKETEYKKTMYIKAVCNARTKPITGASISKKYSTVGAEIKVIAKTNTEYYKLADNSYIHQSFVTETKPTQANTTTPSANPAYAKQPNRNMPTFTVDTSIVGASGNHGDFDGSSYYHAGLDTWILERWWFVYRYGQHPEATSYLKYAPQVSPYQEDGDYDPFNPGREPGSGCYYCKVCHGWIDSAYWENGKHFDNNPKHK